MDTLQSLRGKSDGAKDLKTVVKAMKAMAASNIVQYETAVSALGDYYRTVALGLVAYLKGQKINAISYKEPKKDNEKVVCAIVFGSDQGLVGQFNDVMAGFVSAALQAMPCKKIIWAVGERVQLLLTDMGFTVAKLYAVPYDVNAITRLIAQILASSQESQEKQGVQEFYIFHNQPKAGTGYMPVEQRFLPLDEKWKDGLEKFAWPTKNLPQIAGNTEHTLFALVREYLFTSLFKACAESLASENASRLEAMQRADKNIEELLASLTAKFQRLRQSNIDEELFDVVSGFEALNGTLQKQI
jgi:F-type H+-transporting ATPase subunit gamma